MNPGHRLTATPYYGGKASHLQWLLPLLPQTRVYVESYGGGASVLLNRRPSPLEVYNDLDQDVVTFFRVLRDEPQRFLDALALTPYSRQEYRTASLERAPADDVERARRFFVRARQGFAAAPHVTKPGAWSFQTSIVNRGMSAAVSKWLSTVEGLPRVVERLKRVQIDHLPAIDVIKRYDAPDVTHYIDPPYDLDSRSDDRAYAGHEMTEAGHRELSAVLSAIVGKAAVSGYHSPLYDSLYTRDAGWWCSERETRSTASVRGDTARVECLWTNYDPPGDAARKAAESSVQLSFIDLTFE